MGYKLYVGSLPLNCSKKQLQEIFSPYGNIKHIQLLTNLISRKNTGYAYVIMENKQDALNAIKHFREKKISQLENKVISVTLARGFIERILYGFYSYRYSLIINPIHLILTLWKSRFLLNGKNWEYYPHFFLQGAFVAPFYWTRALNLKTFGRNGISPYMGLGKHDLTRYWFYTLLSLNTYKKAGAITLLLSMAFWWLSHLLWFYTLSGNTQWFSLIMLFSLISTSFYRQTFVCQNYNVMGWMFLPLILFAWMTQNWFLASAILLTASFFSITVIFICIFLSLALTLQIESTSPLIAVLPACIKFSLHFYPMLVKGNFTKTILELSKALGFLAKKSAKYKRQNNFNKTNINIYIKWFLIYLQFIATYYLLNNYFPPLFIAAIIIWIFNSTIFRFADEQSMEILIFTISTASLFLVQSPNSYLLLSYWLLASPFFLKTYILTPINIKNLLKHIENFFSKICQDKRVLICFSNPEGSYHKLFDGQRNLLDWPMFVANSKKFHLMPDISSTVKVNYNGAPDFWGRDVPDVIRQLKYWNADYCIIHQDTSTSLDEKWKKAGFIKVAHLSWDNINKNLCKIPTPPNGYPEWFLLKKI